MYWENVLILPMIQSGLNGNSIKGTVRSHQNRRWGVVPNDIVSSEGRLEGGRDLCCFLEKSINCDARVS